MTDNQGSAGATRRRFLKYAGTAGVIGTGSVAAWNVLWASDETAGADGPAASPNDTSGSDGPVADPDYPYAGRFDTVVDVAERGGDTGGDEPINGLLESNLADDTLFYFREGTYRLTGLFVVQHHDNVGLVGPDATLKPADGQIGDWLIASDVSRFLLEGLTLSNAAERTGVRSKIHVSGGRNVVRDVSVTGFHDVPERTHGFTLQVNGADTVLGLENVRLTDGAHNGTAMFVHPGRNPGTLRLENCHIANWYEQGLYGSSHGGPMYVVGGRYANNGKAQVRVGGGAADTESIVRNVTIRMTDPQPAEAKGGVWGLWLHEGAGTLVENCDIAVTDLSKAGSSGALVLGPEQGATTVRNTTIQVDDSTFAIAATSPKTDDFVIPSMDQPPDTWDLTAEDVTITGSADSDVGIWIVDRPGCRLHNVTIDQRGANRDGIGLLRSPGTEITGLSCSTAGYPVLTSVTPDVEGCLVSLAEIDTLESQNHQVDGTSEASTSLPTEELAASAGGTPAADSRWPNGEVQALRPTDGRYCLDPADFDVTDARPVLGVVGLDSDELYVRTLAESALLPY
ncbi:hypothetical protein ACKVMT_13285 [Halobacteriales archaeon Cl-PHB]